MPEDDCLCRQPQQECSLGTAGTGDAQDACGLGLTMNLCFGPEGTPGGALTATSHSSSYSMFTGSASATRGMSFLPSRMRVCTLQQAEEALNHLLLLLLGCMGQRGAR